jgi:FAD/FMN-containing dehydrogenase
MTVKLAPQVLQELYTRLGGEAEILVDKTSPLFREYAKRWTDIDRQIPSAIVLPDSVSQIQKTIGWAHDFSVPFVTKSGGHSQWSTIGEDGIIIDLSKFSGVEVDSVAKTATLKGSVLSKDVAVALAAEGFFTGKSSTRGAHARTTVVLSQLTMG